MSTHAGSSRTMLGEIRALVAGGATRAAKAERVAELLRRNGGYRWVGIYDVGPEEIAAIAWSGETSPAYPRFPAGQGLCGAAVCSRAPVVVGDVTKDARYLTTFGSTRSEMIVPVLHPATGAVLGLIDVESERVNSFTDRDLALLQECSSALIGLWK